MLSAEAPGFQATIEPVCQHSSLRRDPAAEQHRLRAEEIDDIHDPCPQMADIVVRQLHPCRVFLFRGSEYHLRVQFPDLSPAEFPEQGIRVRQGCSLRIPDERCGGYICLQAAPAPACAQLSAFIDCHMPKLTSACQPAAEEPAA